MTVYQRIDQAELERFTRAIFEAVGVPPENAAQVADNLVQGELHGLGSHGVSRLLPVYAERFLAGGINPRPQVRVAQRDRGAAVVDGDGGPGAVVGQFAMSLALDLAREHGSGWVAVRNSNHFGACFLYAQRAMLLGMIGLTTTNAVPQVAPYGGRENRLGTNPICIAIPGARQNILLDMATSVVARGKVQVAALEGKSIPLGWALDKEGRGVTDPNLAASLLPAGGYKGYGLALVVEVLSALLSGAAFGRQLGGLFTDYERTQQMGHFFGAWDIAAFTSVDAFRTCVDALMDEIKATPLAAGFDKILMPGEPEQRKAAEYRVEGIPLAEDVLASFQTLAARLGMPVLRTR